MLDQKVDHKIIDYGDDCKAFDLGNITEALIVGSSLKTVAFRYVASSFIGLLVFSLLLGGSFALAGYFFIQSGSVDEGVKSGATIGFVLGGILVVGGPIFYFLAARTISPIMPKDIEPLKRRRSQTLVLWLMYSALPVFIIICQIIGNVQAFKEFFQAQGDAVFLVITVSISLTICSLLAVGACAFQEQKFRDDILTNFRKWYDAKAKYTD